ncbi:hypothetical protein KHQ88_04355 [Mycoplasmatota bacterium]|nr:hypothetical protein KHQ88_04355 [Mycoplasmatota bacterium]
MYKKLKDVLPVLIIVFAVLIALMMVFNVLSTEEGDNIMNGFTAIFGGEVASIGDFASVDVEFSFYNFLAFVLPAILGILLFVLSKGSKEKSLVGLMFNVIILAAFIFSLVIFANLGAYTEGSASAFGGTVNYTYEGSSLGLGGIFAMVFSIGGILTSLLNILIQVK